MADDFPITDRTRMRRRAKRATYDRAIVYSILDEALIASVATVIDGRPQVQPMIHVRDGDRLILHGHGTNRLLSAIAAGAEACINATIIDALALARRPEDHSMHYRSATVYGTGALIEGEAEKQRAMEQVFASLVRSNRFHSLPSLPPGYLAGTMVVDVAIEDAVGKVNDAVDTAGGPDGVWSGLIPLGLGIGAPLADERTLAEGVSAGADITGYSRSRGS